LVKLVAVIRAREEIDRNASKPGREVDRSPEIRNTDIRSCVRSVLTVGKLYMARGQSRRIGAITGTAAPRTAISNQFEPQ
jgi:hypothetical protein